MQYDALSRRTDTHSTLLVARTRLVRGSLARASDIRSEKMWKSATTNGGDQEAYHDGVAIDARRCRVSKGAGDTSAKRIHAAAVRWSSSAADGGERGGGHVVVTKMLTCGTVTARDAVRVQVPVIKISMGAMQRLAKVQRMYLHLVGTGVCVRARMGSCSPCM